MRVIGGWTEIGDDDINHLGNILKRISNKVLEPLDILKFLLSCEALLFSHSCFGRLRVYYCKSSQKEVSLLKE